MKSYKKHAFTLVELIVAATILVILTAVGFYNYTKNIGDAKDSRRATDIAALGSQLSLYKKQRGAYPVPGSSFYILNRTEQVAIQWKMDNNVSLSTAESLPKDPDLDIFYSYSTTKNRQEYQLSASLENGENPIALLEWNYKSVSKNILPTIMLATWATSDVEINVNNGWDENRKLFVFKNGFHNLVYEFDTWNPYTDSTGSDGTYFGALLTDAGEDFWQNSDYRDCGEIARAGKRITADGNTDQYQIRDTNGNLVDQNCSCTSTGCTNV